MKISMIMLAAGNSRRFGSNKLLYPVEGIPMYARTLRCLTEAKKAFDKEGDMEISLTVVTQYEVIEKAAKEAGADVFYNPNPEDGISSSLKIGLKENLEADGCLFAVSDQPWLREGTIEALIRLFRWSGKGMACLSYKGQPGNPCIFSSAYYQQLMSLEKDRGGKKVLMSNLRDAALLEIQDERELMDMDTRL